MADNRRNLIETPLGPSPRNRGRGPTVFSPSLVHMNSSPLDLHACASARAAELPGATLTHPFGPDWDVFKAVSYTHLTLPTIYSV